MKDLINRQDAIDAIDALHDKPNAWLEYAVDAVKKLPSAQSEKVNEQIKWERDIAVQQLQALGYGLGEKIRTDSDTISRQAAIDHWRLIIDATNTDSGYNMGFVDGLEFCISHLSTMPSAQPEIIRCRNCKFASGDSRICMKFGHSPIGELDFCAWAERRTDG